MAIDVLLTGFEPFDGEAINPSWEAVRALDGWRTSVGQGDAAVELRVHARRISCVFACAIGELAAAVDELRPALVIAVGQAGGRAEITPERVAINLSDGRICDNAGCQPVDKPVVPGGPAAYFATLPVKAIAQALREAGIPAAVSHTAGTFVCNHLFYGLMHLAAQHGGVLRGGFIHVPWLPEQPAARAGAPALPLDTVVQALRIAVRVSASPRDDVRRPGGTLH